MSALLNVNKFWDNLDDSYSKYKMKGESAYDYLCRLTNYSPADNSSDVEYIKSKIVKSVDNNNQSDVDLYSRLVLKLEKADKFLRTYKYKDITSIEEVLEGQSQTVRSSVCKKFDERIILPDQKGINITTINISNVELFERFNSFVPIRTVNEYRQPMIVNIENPVDTFFALGKNKHLYNLVNAPDSSFRKEIAYLVSTLQKSKKLTLKSLFVGKESITVDANKINISIGSKVISANKSEINTLIDNVCFIKYVLNSIEWKIVFLYEHN